MRVLLDTHIWLWTLTDADSLPARLRARLGSRRDTFLISAVSAWEVAIKASLGRLRLPLDVATFLRAVARDLPAAELPVAHAHAARVAELPLHHRDPFDRMLIAQAQVEGLAIMTVDPAFQAYGVSLITA
ncbi:MAG: type II toxin-antitoxin system VapC family toxin [Candidatus Rokuibacteriota bacterium]